MRGKERLFNEFERIFYGRIKSPFLKDRDSNLAFVRYATIPNGQPTVNEYNYYILHDFSCLLVYALARASKPFGGKHRVLKTSIKLGRCSVFCTRRVSDVRTRIFRYDCAPVSCYT